MSEEGERHAIGGDDTDSNETSDAEACVGFDRYIMSLGVAHRCRKPECGWLMEGYAGADARLARSRESIARRSQWHEVAVYPPLNGGDLLIG